jgi:hypothetical protein
MSLALTIGFAVAIVLVVVAILGIILDRTAED